MHEQPLAQPGDRRSPKPIVSNFAYDEVMRRAKKFQQEGRPVRIDANTVQNSPPKIESDFDFDVAYKRARDFEKERRDRHEIM
jgi:hypothetical protein